MTHTEIVDQFLKQNLKEGDLVELRLTSGELITGRLSFGRVKADENGNGEEINSRIGLLPPPPPPGHYVAPIPTPVFSVNIKEINKL